MNKINYNRFLLSVWLILLAGGQTHELYADADTDAAVEDYQPPFRWTLPETMTDTETALVMALKKPLLQGLDVEAALGAWLKGHVDSARGDQTAAAAAWNQGLKLLDAELQPLPTTAWDEIPEAELEIIQELPPEKLGRTARFFIVGWKTDGLRQYGVLITPGADKLPDLRSPQSAFPLILYLHGAAFGVPVHSLPWLAAHAELGYVIIAPALRGEPLFAGTVEGLPEHFHCEGQIENLDGEVNDALSAVNASWKLPYVQPDKFAMLGHSFGAGVGLLAAARASENAACVISYDAWLTNPFRYYWDRMRRWANNWLSWEEYCRQPPKIQLAGLMRRSIVHHAQHLRCPLLLFIGGGYEGSVFHQSHADLLAALKKHGHQNFDYDVVPDGGHNFVLYYNSAPARYAIRKHVAFLRKHLPPGPLPLIRHNKKRHPETAVPVAPEGD